MHLNQVLGRVAPARQERMEQEVSSARPVLLGTILALLGLLCVYLAPLAPFLRI